MKSIILLSLITISLSIAQEDMLVTDAPGSVLVECCDWELDSLSQLPPVIRSSLDTVLFERLGPFRNKVKFAGGQEIDTDEYFRRFPHTGARKWVLPAYHLNFILTDTSVGIAGYCITIRLDKYGQLLDIDFPQSKTKIRPLKRAIELATSRAKRDGKLTNGIKVDLHFDRHRNALVWIIMFFQTQSEYQIYNYDAHGLQFLGSHQGWIDLD